MQKTSLRKNIFSLLAMQAINYLVPLITLPYLTRTLGVDQYGALNLALSLIQYGVLFITFGFNLSATQYIARHRDQPQIISRVFWETVFSKVILLVIACITLAFIAITFEVFYQSKQLIFIFFLQLIAVAIDPIWFFQGMEKLSKVSIINSIIRLMNIPLLILFVHSPSDVNKAALIQAIILVAISTVNITFVYREKIISLLHIKDLKVVLALKNSLPFFLGYIAIGLYNTTTPIILGIFSTYTEIGIFSASFRLQTAAVGMFLVLSQVLYPRVNSLFKLNAELGYSFIKKCTIIISPLLVLSSIIFYILAPPVANFLLGSEFSTTDSSLKIMAPLIFIVPFITLMTHGVLLPLGFRHAYYVIPGVIGILHIFYTSILVSFYGSIGASIGILITELLVLLAILFFVIKKTNILLKK